MSAAPDRPVRSPAERAEQRMLHVIGVRAFAASFVANGIWAAAASEPRYWWALKLCFLAAVIAQFVRRPQVPWIGFGVGLGAIAAQVVVGTFLSLLFGQYGGG